MFFKFAQICEVFDHSPFSPKARSMAERCLRIRGVKFSAVFVTVRFRIVLSVFGEKAKSNFAFSAEGRSYTNRCIGKCGENCELSAVYSVFREEAKLCVFGEYEE